MGRDTLQVPLSLFWSRSSSCNIYQKFKFTNFPIKKVSDSCDNIFVQHVTHVTDARRAITEQRYKNFSSDSIGICNQFEKVYPSASPTNRIFRLGDRFCRNETISSSKKGGGDCSDVSCNGRQFDYKGFDKVTRETDFHNSSNFTSETSDSLPAADTNTGPEKKHDLPICDFSGPAGQRRATPRSNHIFRCIEDWLGCFVSRDYHRGSMVFSRENLADKCSRIRSSEASNSFFYKIQETKINSSTDRQHDSSLLFIKHGRNPEQTFNQDLERNLGLSHREENTFDSRIYTQSEQSNSRLGIPKLPGQQRMETLPNCFQTNLQSFRETIIGPVCFQTLPPTATIHNLATRPSKSSNRCISTGLEIPISVCFSTILNDRKGIKESSKRPDQHDHCYTCLAEPVMVSNPVENDYQKSNSLTKSSKILAPSRRENSSSNTKLITETGDMASIRQSLSSKGISERAINLISSDRRIGSQSNYESPWRRWVIWCHRKQTGLFSNRLRKVLDFFAGIFELGFEYSTINTHRSVISTFHEPGEGFSVG